MDAARALLHDHLVVGPAFAVLKYVAMVASYLSGIPGGIFSPSLGIGAWPSGWFPASRLRPSWYSG